ncbi:hypothetical protein [Priestia taiwanensis]|uniref:Uncharacterized protein n=1 Tax=Priestia taiwanensis TaxID=1347902 RepID=A0A917EUG8_9BACI|nr:hypothetical protein [Priestia taiwanensis]MBM7365301.1 hypothetical protein [Priestia taiwanensis]GGE86010.1 hypothetical protein GCM10007140_39240 [Priestia taiwanensis]
MNNKKLQVLTKAELEKTNGGGKIGKWLGYQTGKIAGKIFK